MRALQGDWSEAASTSTASLRMEAAHDCDDPALAVLVGELSVQHEEFRNWWAAHKVTGTTAGRKHYCHPVVGELILDCDMWESPDGGGQRLMVLTAEPGTASTNCYASSLPGPRLLTPRSPSGPGPLGL